MTTKECATRDRRIIDSISLMFHTNGQLRKYAASLQVSIENAAIVLRGELPSVAMKAELVPAIRRAGVLGQVRDCVCVTG